MNCVMFPKESLNFLRQLRENNTKEWFEAHRSNYEQLILEPSRAYVVEMGEHLQALVPTINAVPKVNGSLFRIYRDVRFSKDKTPIKTRIGLIFWQGRGKRMQSSAFYAHFNPEELFIAAGIRSFSKEMLVVYREYIKNEAHRISLHVILEAMTCKGFALPQPAYKRLPRGFDKTMKHVDLALYDGMYVTKTMTSDTLCSTHLIETLFDIYEAMLPLQQWVYEMTLSE